MRMPRMVVMTLDVPVGKEGQRGGERGDFVLLILG